ncbi:MAG: glycosyltransferase family 4 protein [Candidatus Magasanikbacteria bacterium]|nr:glycosyltransferase family 4 protein [Candidatus Magasanikbacteria bacterium]MCA9391470.1 glycosyltransferase family 4 protein [Candidatus Magasanikbacteria bacterium]USN52695.1 MAG: glycosyltransferase family 4 protein [Candidatus Nomurabacteria bacterium]HPF95464.1 glycosyltransferase [bacterium]
MNILITIQAVDLDDPLNGFFHEWLKEASHHFDAITVLALRVGRHDLPKNITIIPMRKAGSRSKLEAFWTLVRTSWQRRKMYDGVFVRTDAIYVLLCGWLWRLLAKPVVFWYAHYKPNKLLPFAEQIATVVVTSVPEAYPGRAMMAERLGQGIDESRFLVHEKTEHAMLRLLVLGRVQRIKGVKEIVSEFIREGAYGGKAQLTIVGPALDRDYEKEIEDLCVGRKDIRWIKGLSYDEIPSLLAEQDVLVNAYSGSLDKVIVESMMMGMIPVVATRGLCHTVPLEWRWMVAETPEERIRAIRKILSLASEERTRYAKRVRELAIRDHSMRGQIERLANLFTRYE